MTGQTEIHFDAEPECPGFDVCPVVMCGCRWLGTGEAFRGENEHDSNLPQ